MKPNEATTMPANAVPRAETAVRTDAPAPANAGPATVANYKVSPAKLEASGPDLLMPTPKRTPFTNGATARRTALDLLYESSKAEPERARKDEVGAGAEAPKAQPSGPLWLEPRPAPRHKHAARESDSCAQDWMVQDPNDAPVSCGAGHGKLGKRFKPKPAGAAPPRVDMLLSDSDKPEDSGDRLHRLGVVADIYIMPLRPPKMTRPGSLPALRPKSRADCERRCGSDGFCDPSNLLGCGGVHCGRQGDMLY